MSTIKFDTAAINELHGRLAVLTEELRASGALPVLTDDQFGSSVLTHRMKDFAHDWSDGMDRIVGELDHTIELLREAVAKYGHTETTVQAAVTVKQ